MIAKEPGQVAYEAKWEGYGWVLPWHFLSKATRAKWEVVERACVVAATEANIMLAEQVMFASAALDGADSTRLGLIEENRALRAMLAEAANGMDAVREVLASRRKYGADVLASWDALILKLREVSAPGRDKLGQPLSPVTDP